MFSSLPSTAGRSLGNCLEKKFQTEDCKEQAKQGGEALDSDVRQRLLIYQLLPWLNGDFLPKEAVTRPGGW